MATYNYTEQVMCYRPVTWVDQSKTVEVWIMLFLSYSSPIPLVFADKFQPEF